MAHSGTRIMDTLADDDPDPARLARLDSLRVTRALTLLPPNPGGPLLWAARRSDGAAGVFLAGAGRAERLGQPATARLWLALERLGRGDRSGANQLLRDAGTSLTLSERINPREAATWENEPLGRTLRVSLGIR